VTEILSAYAAECGADAGDPQRIKFAIKGMVPFWTGKTLREITPDNCKAYARQRKQIRRRKGGAPLVKPVSPDTIRRELGGVLVPAITHAFRNNRITHTVAVPLPDKGEPRDRWLTRSEAAALMWAARKQRMPRSQFGPYRPIPLQLFILLACYTGRRKEAILSRQWPHVNFRERMLDFRRLGVPETKKRRGRCALNRKLLGHLRRAKARHGTDMGFIIHKRGERIGDIKRSFMTTAARAGFGPEVTPHVLKHTAAMWMKLAKVPIQQAAEALATSIETLEKVYQGHEDAAYILEAVEAI
jgi:integrase